MKKILIAIDYNSSAQKIARIGCELANAMNAVVAIAHVVEGAGYYDVEYSPVMRDQGTYAAGKNGEGKNLYNEAKDFLSATIKHLDGNNITAKVLEGETANSILKYSEDWQADLIVMGSHRNRGLASLLVTPVARYVLNHSKIPLLTIPTND